MIKVLLFIYLIFVIQLLFDICYLKLILNDRLQSNIRK